MATNIIIKIFVIDIDDDTGCTGVFLRYEGTSIDDAMAAYLRGYGADYAIVEVNGKESDELSDAVTKLGDSLLREKRNHR